MMDDSPELAPRGGATTGGREHQRMRLRPISWLSRSVARRPVGIGTKLLGALGVIVAVLVVIGGLGLRVLGESNARFGTLATLQRKAATYRALQTQNSQLRALISARTSLFPGVAVPTDDTVDSTLRQFRESYDLRRRVAVEDSDERKRVAGIQSDYERLVGVMRNAIQLARAGRYPKAQQLLRTQPIPTSDGIVSAPDQLANRADARTAALVSENSSSYDNSRLISWSWQQQPSCSLSSSGS